MTNGIRNYSGRQELVGPDCYNIISELMENKALKH